MGRCPTVLALRVKLALRGLRTSEPGAVASRPSPAVVSPVAEGDVLAAKYQVQRVIGQGAMGVVVAALHLRLGHLVAIKLLPASASRDERVVRRFVREGRAVARLRSDHVARVLDAGELATGEPFLVMEYLEGADLGAVLEAGGPMSVDVACDYVVQACEAVGEAHALGIVHRDLKPENLFLAAGLGGAGLVKVLDFGVSKLLTSEQAALTQTDTVVGSPLYMAPEQLRSSRVADPRSDVWSLGVVLFELLTARYPFEAPSLPDLCMKIVHEPPVPVTELRPEVPAVLADVIARCLAKDPSRRFANAAELAEALAQCARERAVEAAQSVQVASGSLAETMDASPAPTRRGPVWAAVVVVLCIAGAWTARALAQRSAEPLPAYAAVDAALSASEQALPGWIEIPTESPAVAPAAPTPAPATAASRAPIQRVRAPARAPHVAPVPRATDDDIPAFR